MTTVLSDECISNILGHIKACWNYNYPTGNTLENAFFEGIRPFYTDAKSLGGPNTMVDVGKDQEAFDIKGKKVLGHLSKLTKASNYEENIFVKQLVPGKGKINVKVPKSIMTQIRRPKVNLKNYKGNAKKILTEQITDYHQFAVKTTNKAGYQDLFSVVLLYGIDVKKGYKSVFLTIEKFDIPAVAKFSIGTKKDNVTPGSYLGADDKNNTLFSLITFSTNSSNFSKRFYTTYGELMTWSIEDTDPVIYTRSELEKTCAVTTVR